jgi:hypothetical protein
MLVIAIGFEQLLKVTALDACRFRRWGFRARTIWQAATESCSMIWSATVLVDHL